MFSSNFSLLQQSVESKNIHEVFPRRKYFSRLIEYFCQDGTYFQKICLMFILNFVGVDYDQFNAVGLFSIEKYSKLMVGFFQTLIPKFARYYPAGTSLRMGSNLYQLYTTGENLNRIS